MGMRGELGVCECVCVCVCVCGGGGGGEDGNIMWKKVVSHRLVNVRIQDVGLTFLLSILSGKAFIILF